MAASDNVLRGGLTPKHIDVSELLEVLDFTPMPPPRLEPERPGPGVEVFRPGVRDFVLYRVQAAESDGPRIALTGPAIVLAEGDEVWLEGADGVGSLARGEAVYVTPDEAELTVTGPGTAWIATTG